jgi:hypothetical protein
MASNNHNPQSPSGNAPIPLQDLSRPPDTVIADGRGRRRESSSSSGGGIDGFGLGRRSLIGRGSMRRRYERIAEDSPTSRDRQGFNSTSQGYPGPRGNPYATDGDGDVSIDDPGGFQQAMTSVGLSFDGPSTTHLPGMDHQGRPGQSRSIRTGDDDLGTFTPGLDPETYGSPTDTIEGDTTPLNDGRYMQPISGSSASQRTGRSRGHSVHFSEEVSGSRLGDDLPNLENGMGKHGRGSTDESRLGHERSRSLSPSGSNSAISRASSMMRMMSQRVVNLSNEPEVVEQSIRRESSLKQARLEGPPPLPAMTEYAHDASPNGLPDGPPPEKKPSVTMKMKSIGIRRRSINPLRGNSLGIFPPENRLRQLLCEMLVHPITEPIILILIIIQTIILAVESAQDVYPGHWGVSRFDYAFFVLFIIYTLELISRTIVSGFLWNPYEYSTLDRSAGLKKALIEKGRSFFIPQDQASTRKSAVPENSQVSVLRSFTGMQPPLDPEDDPRHQQRVRLARRAFLRHSFNRLDFIAVVSYWISFVLSLTGMEASRNIYVFRMLSCLRILRLLNLTRGTSVSFPVSQMVSVNTNLLPGNPSKSEESRAITC